MESLGAFSTVQLPVMIMAEAPAHGAHGKSPCPSAHSGRAGALGFMQPVCTFWRFIPTSIILVTSTGIIICMIDEVYSAWLKNSRTPGYSAMETEFMGLFGMNGRFSDRLPFPLFIFGIFRSDSCVFSSFHHNQFRQTAVSPGNARVSRKIAFP